MKSTTKFKTALLGSALLLSVFVACKKEKDEEQPKVTITGKTLDRVLSPKHYVDPGATATDNKDGDLTSSIVAHSSIDYNNPNCTYDIYYSAKDAAGNEGSTGQRLVMLISLATPMGGTAGNVTWNETPEYFIGDSLRFQQFGGYLGAKIKADMPNDSTFTIPTQTKLCGDAPQVLRTFSGTGSLTYARSGPGIRITANINYTKVENGVTTTGTMVYSH